MCADRCRLGTGEGTLEKVVGCNEIRAPEPLPGFRYSLGQTVQIERPSGLLELATVIFGSMDGADRVYRVRLHAFPDGTSAAAAGSGCVYEQQYEEDLQQPMPQAGCAFYVGQLVHTKPPRGQPGPRKLARVVEFVLKDYELVYMCAPESLDSIVL